MTVTSSLRRSCLRLFVAAALASMLGGSLTMGSVSAWAKAPKSDKPVRRRAVEASPPAGVHEEQVPAEANAEAKADGGKVEGKKAKVLTFGAMDVEGKMRTPQLLFFLNRVKAELDSTTVLEKSFMKELDATAKEKGL
ncbi:MAG: hypothetical protein KA712_10840 [Myxococcales bacterium]|nr:hypothetical protein [Myxococcales bacterium]